MARLGFALLLIVVLARAAFQFGILSVSLGDRLPCPERPRHARPALFHFSPGLAEHQSWIEALVTDPDATDFVLCLDGRVVAEGIGQTPEHGLVRASVRTTWIDLQWLLGSLNQYERPERWDLGYTTYTIRQISQRALNQP